MSSLCKTTFALKKDEHVVTYAIVSFAANQVFAL